MMISVDLPAVIMEQSQCRTSKHYNVLLRRWEAIPPKNFAGQEDFRRKRKQISKIVRRLHLQAYDLHTRHSKTQSASQD